MTVDDLRRKVAARRQAAAVPRRMRALQQANDTSTESVLGTAPAAVSLTSHGGRVQNVFTVIEAIGAGTVRPQRLVLWLNDAATVADPPASLQRLQRRGLEIALSDNFGPHTKYYPYVAATASHDLALATADDDVLYARDWLETLLSGAAAAERAQRREVVCHRARRVQLSDDGIAPYSTWPYAADTSATVRTFATGVGGVLYPPPLLDALHADGDAFRACCPRADDIWLHAVTIRNGYRARQLASVPREGPYLPFGKGQSLWRTNVDQGGNDEAVAATYTAADVRLLAADR